MAFAALAFVFLFSVMISLLTDAGTGDLRWNECLLRGTRCVSGKSERACLALIQGSRGIKRGEEYLLFASCLKGQEFCISTQMFRSSALIYISTWSAGG